MVSKVSHHMRSLPQPYIGKPMNNEVTFKIFSKMITLKIYTVILLIILFSFLIANAETKKSKKEVIPKEPVLNPVPLILNQNEPSESELIEKCELIYKQSKNMQARYVQKVKKNDPEKRREAEVVRSQGKVYVQIPSRMIWEIESPVTYTVVSNRQTLWLYNPISQIVQIQSFSSLNPGSKFVTDLFLGKTKLKDIFEVQRSLENAHKLELTPKTKSPIKKMYMTFDPIHFWAENIEIENTNGDTYEIEFTSMQRNLPEMPQMDVFNKKNQFMIPEGVITAR